jgi:hypothetical protein
MMRWIVAVAVCVLVSVPARADEEKVPLDKLPKAVSGAVKKKFPKAKLVSASKELEDKKTVYEVTLEDGEQKVQVTVTPEGEITEVEKEIPAKDLPKAVRAALDDKYAKATLEKAEEVTKGKELTYEVLLITKDKKTLEIKFDPKGKVLNVEEKKQKKGEK